MVRVRDLNEPAEWSGEVLHCPECGRDWSANRSDYVKTNPDHVFRCAAGHPPRNLRLAIRRTVYETLR